MIYGYLLSIAYIPGWTGFALPTGWLFLTATLPFVLRSGIVRWPHLFLLYAALGLLWTPIPTQGLYDLWKLLILSGAFVMGLSRLDTIKLIFGVTAGYLVSIVIALFQLTGWDLTTRPYADPAGLFFNPNVFGEVGALLAIGLFASGFTWLSLIPAMGVVLSHSRTAVLALLVCGVVGCLHRRLWYVIAILVVIASPVAFLKPFSSLTERVAIWGNTIDGLTWFGRGPGSFVITYPVFATRTDTLASREEDAHNDFLQLVYQYGVGTALLLPLLAVGLFGPLGPERYLFIGFCVIAMFNFPLEIPLEGFLGAFALGRLWRSRHSLRWYRVVCRWAFPGRLRESEPSHG